AVPARPGAGCCLLASTCTAARPFRGRRADVGRRGVSGRDRAGAAARAPADGPALPARGRRVLAAVAPGRTRRLGRDAGGARDAVHARLRPGLGTLRPRLSKAPGGTANLSVRARAVLGPARADGLG